MFFISWGSRVYRRYFGVREQLFCTVCAQERDFVSVVIYKVVHILWAFRWVTEKTYARVCQICGRGDKLNTAEVEKGLKKPIIPFIDRMGWIFGVGLIAVFVTGAAISGEVQRRNDIAYLQKPAVNDVYEIDLAKLEKTPEAPVMYSTMIVTNVSGDAVEVRIAKIYSNQLSGIQADVDDGKAKSSDFYAEQRAVFPLAGLRKMRDDGALIAVVR